MIMYILGIDPKTNANCGYWFIGYRYREGDKRTAKGRRDRRRCFYAAKADASKVRRL